MKHPALLKKIPFVSALLLTVLSAFGGPPSGAPGPATEDGKVRYFQAVMAGPWTVTAENRPPATFEFDRDQRCDLAEIFGGKLPLRTRAVCRNRFTLPEAGRVVLGMGCDWWMRCRIDGKVILDTFSTSNRLFPITVGNYGFELDLEAGEHTVELEIKTGRMSNHLAFGNIAPVDPRVLYEPILTDFAPGRMAVSFVTAGAVPAAVDYRKKGSAEWRRVWHSIGGLKAQLERFHRVELTGLEPDCDYEYRLVTEHPYRNFREETGAVRSFRSAPAKFRPFRFFLISDTQFDWEERAERIDRVLKQEAFQKADLLGHLGDFWSCAEDIELSLFPGLLDRFTGKPLIPARGNHEYLGHDATLYSRCFGDSVKLLEYGEVVFLVLDTGNGIRRKPPEPQVMNDPESLWRGQKAFLEQAVASEAFRRARYRVVLAHGQPFCHPSPMLTEPLRALIDPFFAGKEPKVKIDLWVSGHRHRAIRTIPGTNQVYARQQLGAQRSGEAYHFPIVVLSGPNSRFNPEALQMSTLELEFTAEGIHARARDLDGDCFDHFTVLPGGAVRDEFLRSDFRRFTVPEPETAGDHRPNGADPAKSAIQR